MQAAIFGAGYVGSVGAACLAECGHEIVLVDVDPAKVDAINKGSAPIAEPGLQDLIAANVAAGRLRATLSAPDAIASTELCLLCVGTPSLPNGDVDLTHVRSACASIGQALQGLNRFYSVVVRSTMLPESMEQVVIPELERASGLRAGEGFGIALYPEFLRESTAIADFRDPPITLFGALDRTTLERMRALHEPLPGTEIVTDIRTAEAVKYTNNAWHATKVTFANEIGNLCRSVGIDGQRVMEILCQDTRLNVSPAYMRPGFAFGGSCLPKDLRALMALGRRKQVPTPVCSALMEANGGQIERALGMVQNLGRSRVGLLGLTFKADTGDLRESPLLTLAERLVGSGFDLKIYDSNVEPGDYLNGLSACLTPSIEDLYDHAEVIVIGNSAREFGSALDRAEHGVDVIDLIRVDPKRTSGSHYHGICW